MKSTTSNNNSHNILLAECLILVPINVFLQVWSVNGEEKILLAVPDQTKFYTGDCYIYQYLYPEEDQEECLIGTWFGKESIEVIH